MKKFCLDRNCLIDVEQNRLNAPFVVELLQRAEKAIISVSILGIIASEKERDGSYANTFDEFQNWLLKLGASDLPILRPVRIWGVTFWGHDIWGDKAVNLQLAKVHSVINPNIDLEWPTYANRISVDPADMASNKYKKWRNAICDSQLAWGTIYYDQDCLVTRNTDDFQKHRLQLEQCGLRQIASPAEALKLV